MGQQRTPAAAITSGATTSNPGYRVDPVASPSTCINAEAKNLTRPQGESDKSHILQIKVAATVHVSSLGTRHGSVCCMRNIVVSTTVPIKVPQAVKYKHSVLPGIKLSESMVLFYGIHELCREHANCSNFVRKKSPS